MFTRHFIEGMLGAADERSGDGNGSIELAELKRYLQSRVSYQARRRYSRDQTPEVHGKLNKVMLAALMPEFTFGDPNATGPLPGLRDRVQAPSPLRQPAPTGSSQKPRAKGDNDPVGDILRTLTGDDTRSAQELDDPYQNNY